MLTDSQLDEAVTKAGESTLPAQLTKAELYFSELIRSGYSGAHAYVKAFPESKSVKLNNRNSIAVAASKLCKKPPLKAWLKKLGEPSISSPKLNSVLSAAQKRDVLSAVIADPATEPMVRLRAIEIDNRMAGHEAPRVTANLTGNLAIADTLLARFSAIGEAKQVKEIEAPVKPSEVIELKEDSPVPAALET